MKVIDFFWDHPELHRFQREIKAGQYLFSQGQNGNTMFIILRGLVELVAERGKKQYVIGLLPAGHFLGEKAIIQDAPYRRAFTARAKTDSTILEMSLKAIEAVRKAAPEIMNDILKHIFQMAAQRIDRLNYLSTGLRSSNNVERLIHLVIYFARTTGRPGAKGTELVLTPDTISYYIDMVPDQVASVLSELTGKKLLLRDGEEFYTLPNERRLLESLPVLKEQLSQGYYDELEVAP